MKCFLVTALFFLFASAVNATKGRRGGLSSPSSRRLKKKNGKSSSPSGDECFFMDINEDRVFGAGAAPFVGVGTNFLCNDGLACDAGTAIGESSGSCTILGENTAVGITENCELSLVINGDILRIHYVNSFMSVVTMFDAVVLGGTGCYEGLRDQVFSVTVQDLTPDRPRYIYSLGDLY